MTKPWLPMPLKPALKWAGGKRWLVPQLATLWAGNEERRMVEPFAGGLAIALALRPGQALLNDTNPHLVNFLWWLKRGLCIELPMENDRALYYAHRERFNALSTSDAGDSAEAAALFYYLNRTCFNGLCRFNRRGEFNVPFGRYSNITYTRDFGAYSDAFSGWTLSTGDFESVALQPSDFVYADPPYDVQFTQYSRGGFAWDAQVRLAEWLARHPGPVVLSNQATARILSLYAECGFEVHTLAAPRMISRTGDRTPALEVIATRNIDRGRIDEALLRSRPSRAGRGQD
jgi:DNA adenine methylase